MKILFASLLVLAGCDSGRVTTNKGGHMVVYPQKVVPPPTPKGYYDPRPDVPVTYNEYGHCKTYIQK